MEDQEIALPPTALAALGEDYEKIDQPLFHFEFFARSDLSEFVFFTKPRGSNAHQTGDLLTGMYFSGSLPQPQHFVLRAITVECVGEKCVAEYILWRYALELMVGSKSYLNEGPAMVFHREGGRKLTSPILLAGGQNFCVLLSRPSDAPPPPYSGPIALGVRLTGDLYRPVA